MYLELETRQNEINQKNAALEQLIREKDWLIKEMHHRVKNNFQVVAGLLEIQSSYLKNQDARAAIKDSQLRISSMSIIHQRLYQSATFSEINMPEYIYELVEYLRESHATGEAIRFDIQIENIILDHGCAGTLGLILTEAITNAIKYAFTSGQDRKISILLRNCSDAELMLTIADNGRGLPGNFDSKASVTMGMELLQGLSEDLQGSFSIRNEEGTRIDIIFPLPAQPA
jgi:two-component sensor histidine kinase